MYLHGALRYLEELKNICPRDLQSDSAILLKLLSKFTRSTHIKCPHISKTQRAIYSLVSFNFKPTFIQKLKKKGGKKKKRKKGGKCPRGSTDSPGPMLYPTIKSDISTRTNSYFHSIRVILGHCQLNRKEIHPGIY